MRLSDALQEQADQIERGPKAAIAELTKVGHRGANNIKRFARARTSGMAHAPAYPYSITYDHRATTRVLTWEIGPDKNRRQGALGNLIEFGSINNPANPHVGPALSAEEDAWIRYGTEALELLWEGN